MPRSDTDASDRLRGAALELFAEKGFRATTVPEIAERAGLTTRSFFRHYADKREVLFRDDDAVPARIASLLASQPPGLSLSELILWGVQTVGREYLEPQREYLLARHAIVCDDPGLHERDLGKQDEMARALADALQAQGVEPVTATVAGKLTTTISTTAVQSWLDDAAEQPLSTYISAAHRAVVRIAMSPDPAGR